MRLEQIVFGDMNPINLVSERVWKKHSLWSNVALGRKFTGNKGGGDVLSRTFLAARVDLQQGFGKRRAVVVKHQKWKGRVEWID